MDADTGEISEKSERMATENKPERKPYPSQRESHDIARVVQDTMAVLAENTYIRNKEANMLTMNFDSSLTSSSRTTYERDTSSNRADSARSSTTYERGTNPARFSNVGNVYSDFAVASTSTGRVDKPRRGVQEAVGESVKFDDQSGTNSDRRSGFSSSVDGRNKNSNANNKERHKTIEDHARPTVCDINTTSDRKSSGDGVSPYCGLLGGRKDSDKSDEAGTKNENVLSGSLEPETEDFDDFDDNDGSFLVESPGFLSDSGFINLFSNCRRNPTSSRDGDLSGDYARIEEYPRETNLTLTKSNNTEAGPIFYGMNASGDASSAVQTRLSSSSSDTSPPGDLKIKSLILDNFFKVIPCGSLGKPDLSCRPSNTPFQLNVDYLHDIVNQDNINSLPPQVIVYIFRYLSPCTLLRKVSLVCKYWYNWCRDQDLWKHINLMNQHKLTDVHLQQLISFSDRVTSVNLTDCRFVTNVGIKILLARCSHLQVLKLMRCFDLSDDAFKDVFDKNQCSELRCLRLDGCCKVTDSTIIKVARACPLLQILHINQCTKITDHSIKVLADQCPRLTQLLMDHCSQVTEEGLEAIVEGCPYMTYLNIMSCGVTDRGVKLLSHLTNLTNVDLSNIPRLTPDAIIYLSRHCKNLECINISLNSVMNDACVTELARNLPLLKRLYCVSCNISDAGLEKISEFRPTLEALDVGWCQDITDQGVSVISNSCPNLDYFGLIRCDQVSIETVEELVLKYPRVNYSTFVLESRRLLERAQREGFMFGVPTERH